MEKSVSAIEICHLLCTVHRSFPDLQPVMHELAHAGKEQSGGWGGALGEKPVVRLFLTGCVRPAEKRQ